VRNLRQGADPIGGSNMSPRRIGKASVSSTR
jgi:hypothetical protein